MSVAAEATQEPEEAVAAVQQLREKKQTARLMLREFLDDVLDGEDEIVLAEVTVSAQAKFALDEDFQRALLEEALPVMVADELHAIIHRRRSSAADGFVPLALGGVKRAQVDLRAKEIAAGIFVATEPGVRKSFIALRRPELKADIALRKERIAGEQKWIDLESAFVAGMKNDSDSIGEAFSDAAFDRIWRKHLESKND